MVTGSKVKLLWGHEETRRKSSRWRAPLRRTTHSHGPGALERGIRLWRILDGRAGRCVPAPAVRSLPLSLARTRGIRCEGRLFPFTRVGPGARHRLMTRRRITTHHHRPHASACGPVVGARAEHRAKGAAHAIALGHPPEERRFALAARLVHRKCSWPARRPSPSKKLPKTPTYDQNETCFNRRGTTRYRIAQPGYISPALWKSC